MFQGYLTVAVYIHFLSPGSLKLHTNVQVLSPESFEGMFGPPADPVSNRRWLQAKESPYPGYCRAPGGNVCKPVLCNCQKLTEIWIKIQGAKSALQHREAEGREE